MDEPMTTALKTKRVLLTSLWVDVFDLLMNTVVAALTGSVVMLVEALEGFAGLCSVGMLMVAHRRSSRRPTKLHPFGYGREISYWSTVAAFVIVAVVGVLAVRFGYQKIVTDSAEPVRHTWLAYIALVIACGTNFYSFWSSLNRLLDGQPANQVGKLFLNGPAVAPKTTAVLDAMGSTVALVGLLSLGLYGLTSLGDSGPATAFDGIGALCMGVALLLSAVALLISVRGLVMNSSAPRETERRIRDAAREVPEVRHVIGMQTTMVGSDKMLANIDVHLKDGLNTDQVERVVEKVKEATEKTGEGLQVHVEPDAIDEAHEASRRQQQ
jgi:cation diffusion facilitator family transporter